MTKAQSETIRKALNHTANKKKQTKELVKIDRNGSKHYHGLILCDRCGGVGGSTQWTYTGYTCYKCGGSGLMEADWIERTPEYQAKLDARRAARNAARQAEIDAANAKRAAEQEAREAERKAAEERERAERAKSQYVGEIGEKISTKATYAFSAYYDTHDPFGRERRVYIHNFKVGDDVIVWKTGTFPFHVEDGTEVELTGTIKAHDEYKGQKQTAVIRCKVREA